MRSTMLNWLLPVSCCHCTAAAPPGAALCVDCAHELDDLGLAEGPPQSRGFDLSGAVTWSAFEFNGPARSLVHALKYRGGAALAPQLARAVVERAPQWLWRDSVLVPVPAHPSHMAERGFNQSALLAEAVGSQLDLVVLDLLVRRGDHAPQAGARRDERLALPANVFSIAPAVTRDDEISPQFPTNVVVLDDVRTTGVTLEVCASLMSDLFCGEVRAVTFASARRLQSNRKRGPSFDTERSGRPRGSRIREVAPVPVRGA